jgi:hypothetical protein
MKITPVILVLLITGCATQPIQPSMSKAEATRILEQEDPYSREAILALRDHAQLDYESGQRERKPNQVAEHELKLSDVITMITEPSPAGDVLKPDQ